MWSHIRRVSSGSHSISALIHSFIHSKRSFVACSFSLIFSLLNHRNRAYNNAVSHIFNLMPFYFINENWVILFICAPVRYDYIYEFLCNKGGRMATTKSCSALLFSVQYTHSVVCDCERASERASEEWWKKIFAKYIHTSTHIMCVRVCLMEANDFIHANTLAKCYKCTQIIIEMR